MPGVWLPPFPGRYLMLTIGGGEYMPDVVFEARELAKNDKNYWLTVTEKYFDEGKYPFPDDYSVKLYGGEYVTWIDSPTDSQKRINAVILEQLCHEANHLMDYGIRAKELGRDSYLDKIRSRLKTYIIFLNEIGAVKNSSGRFNEVASVKKYLTGGLYGSKLNNAKGFRKI